MSTSRSYRIMVLFALIMALQSCAPTIYYQLYNVDSQEPSVNKDQFSYDYSGITVSYNFWAEKGKSDFVFTNNTEKDIYIDLKSSHLILNNYAITYFQNIIVTTTSNIGTATTYYPTYYYGTVGITAGAGNSIMRIPEPVVCIPANSSKVIDGFQLVKALIYNCDYELFPSKKEIKTQNFDAGKTPLAIKNIISYSFNKSLDSLDRIENAFYISAITNYPKSEIIDSRFSEYCGKKSTSLHQEYFLKSSSKMFFLRYTPADTPWE
jgi:hypothetical protein